MYVFSIKLFFKWNKIRFSETRDFSEDPWCGFVEEFKLASLGAFFSGLFSRSNNQLCPPFWSFTNFVQVENVAIGENPVDGHFEVARVKLAKFDRNQLVEIRVEIEKKPVRLHNKKMAKRAFSVQ